jgi:hypothetical protein
MTNVQVIAPDDGIAINVNQIESGVSLEVDGGAGDDTFNVNARGNVILDGRGGSNVYNINYYGAISNINVRDTGYVNGGGPNTLNINDQGNIDDTGSTAYEIDSTLMQTSLGIVINNGVVERTGQQSFVSVTDDARITYSNIQDVAIYGGDTSNTFNVNSTDANSNSMSIVCGSGSDTVNVTPPYFEPFPLFGANLEALQGPLSITGASNGTTALNIFDYNNSYPFPRATTIPSAPTQSPVPLERQRTATA